MKLRHKVLLSAALSGALLLSPVTALAQSQAVPGLTCGTKKNVQSVYVVTHYPELQVVQQGNQALLQITLTCGANGPVIGTQLIPFSYRVDTTLDALVLTFTVSGTSESSTVFIPATDVETANQLDRYERDLTRAQRHTNVAEEVRLLNELLLLLTGS